MCVHFLRMRKSESGDVCKVLKGISPPPCCTVMFVNSRLAEKRPWWGTNKLKHSVLIIMRHVCLFVCSGCTLLCPGYALPPTLSPGLQRGERLPPRGKMHSRFQKLTLSIELFVLFVVLSDRKDQFSTSLWNKSWTSLSDCPLVHSCQGMFTFILSTERIQITFWQSRRFFSRHLHSFMLFIGIHQFCFCYWFNVYVKLRKIEFRLIWTNLLTTKAVLPFKIAWVFRSARSVQDEMCLFLSGKDPCGASDVVK